MTTGESAAPRMLDAARDTLALGIWPVPIKPGEKRPPMLGWQNLRLSIDDLPKHFSNGNGLGWLLGVKPRPIADVDVDCPEALAVALLIKGPKTDRIFGRKSNPGSHYLFELTEELARVPFEDPVLKREKQQAMLIELRGQGGQTVVPPSTHESGEQIEWERKGDFGRAKLEDLHSWVAKIAAAALLVRYWPRGHEARHALAGVLARAGWTEEATSEFVCAVMRLAQSDNLEARTDVRNCYARLERDDEVAGRTKLEELLGENGQLIISTLAEWLDLKRASADDSCRYRIARGCICVEKDTQHGPVQKPLCNFVARVEEEIVLDDGAETNRAFVLQGTLANGQMLPSVRVSAPKFGGMTWVTDQWGLSAIVNAGFSTHDQLREAIQRMSPSPRRRRVYTHTGWRKIDGAWVFFTAGGAVGSDGFEVDIGTELSKYSLPRTPQNPREAMQASLRLLDVAPLTVTAPLWAAMFRAPLATTCPLDSSLWVEGLTGSLKSTLVALFNSHYGSFTETSLPSSWSSTANQLERRAFVLKDVPFVIDDYAPSGLDSRELEVKAARMLRSQGNLSGRGRLRQDLSERPAYPPRGIIIGTGEQHPPGHSILARTLLLEIDRSTVNMAALSEAQRTRSLLPHAMAACIEWLAPQMDALPEILQKAFDETRHRATADGEHLRVPGILANLWLGLDCGLCCAEEIGALSGPEAVGLRSRCWDALVEAGMRQALSIEGERPTRRFLTVLATLIAQGRAVLLGKDSGCDTHSRASLVGWQDENFIYLLADASFQAVAQFCKDAGEFFPVRSERLMRDFNREEVSECAAGRNTTTVNVGGQKRRVLKLRRDRVEALLGEALPGSMGSGTEGTAGTAPEE
jgi:Bifunctional DNA primase/polymerase, N-terminal/Domain of unknown function (DUF927)